MLYKKYLRQKGLGCGLSGRVPAKQTWDSEFKRKREVLRKESRITSIQ
jgi:hypothetical protein